MTIRLSGRLICTDDAQVEAVTRALPEHARLSRAEPGCLAFDVTQTDDPLIWQVAEHFTDRSAFDAHQARTRLSDWFRQTADIRRDYQIDEQP